MQNHKVCTFVFHKAYQGFGHIDDGALCQHIFHYDVKVDIEHCALGRRKSWELKIEV